MYIMGEKLWRAILIPIKDKPHNIMVDNRANKVAALLFIMCLPRIMIWHLVKLFFIVPQLDGVKGNGLSIP
jgi:hypothetical protein